RHTVTISRRFSLGRYEVTRRQYADFIAATGRETSACEVAGPDAKWSSKQGFNWSKTGFPQSDDHPVVCVSWHDAQAYVQWLSKLAGKSYRFPSEAEGEAAARAGTDTSRYWGNNTDIACRYANARDETFFEWATDKVRLSGHFQCRDGYIYTAPVGSFEPN